MKSLRTTVFTALVACLATGAFAQSATSYTLGLSRTVWQTGTSSTSHAYYSREWKIDGVDPNQFNYGRVEFGRWQGDGVYSFSDLFDSSFHNKTGLYYFEQGLKDDYQDGFWYYLGNNGVDEDSGGISPVADHFSTYSLLSQYDDLQNLYDGQAFDINVTGFTPDAATNESHTSYYLRDTTAGINYLAGTSTGFDGFNLNIPAGLLMGGHSYDLHIIYSASIMTPNAGFSGATSYQAFNNEVINSFYVVPEPGTFAALGLGAVALLRRRKK